MTKGRAWRETYEVKPWHAFHVHNPVYRLANHSRNSERYLFEILPQLIRLIRILLKKIVVFWTLRAEYFPSIHHDVNSDGSYNLFPSLVRKSSFYLLPFLFFSFFFLFFLALPFPKPSQGDRTRDEWWENMAFSLGPQRGRNSCLWLQSRSVLSSFGVVLMSCKVNFHVVRSALQYSACRI